MLPAGVRHRSCAGDTGGGLDLLSVLMVLPERMSVATLVAYVNHLRENQQNSDRYEIALWKKLIYPFAALVMMALALPFAMSHERMGGVSVKVFLGVMLLNESLITFKRSFLIR